MTDPIGSRSLDTLSVLVVEDNVFMRELLKSVLRRLGVADIREAVDGEDAFRVLYVHPVDIIICDIQMQPIDGITFLTMLRDGAAPSGILKLRTVPRTTPVLMLTGVVEEEQIHQARKAGAAGFLVKPVRPELLHERILAALGLPT
jgi:CheY-like chemotaxis protein